MSNHNKIHGSAIKERTRASLTANNGGELDAVQTKAQPYISFMMDAAELNIASQMMSNKAIMQNRKNGLSFEVEKDKEKAACYHITLKHDDDIRFSATISRNAQQDSQWYIIRAGISKVEAEEASGYIKAASILYAQGLAPMPDDEATLVSYILLKAEADGVLPESGKEFKCDENISLYIQHVDQEEQPEISCLLKVKDIVVAKFVFRRTEEKIVRFKCIDSKVIHVMPKNVIESAGSRVIPASRKYISYALAEKAQQLQDEFNESEEGIFRAEQDQLDKIFATYVHSNTQDNKQHS